MMHYLTPIASAPVIPQFANSQDQICWQLINMPRVNREWAAHDRSLWPYGDGALLRVAAKGWKRGQAA